MNETQPSLDESTLAVVKAVAVLRARRRADPAHVGLTAAAIAERVAGIVAPPRPGRGGWWFVGRVLDEIADAEFSVWFMPVARRIGISQRARPSAPPAPPVRSPFYYDGLRRKWIDAATGEIVADAPASGPDASRHESGASAAT
jgi:hypothetical protein